MDKRWYTVWAECSREAWIGGVAEQIQAGDAAEAIRVFRRLVMEAGLELQSTPEVAITN